MKGTKMTIALETTDFAMFSEEGNAAVRGLVVALETVMMINGRMPFDHVYYCLEELAKDSRFAEATDTAVYETVAEVLGYTDEE
jgi:hypothetical protein